MLEISSGTLAKSAFVLSFGGCHSAADRTTSASENLPNEYKTSPAPLCNFLSRAIFQPRPLVPQVVVSWELQRQAIDRSSAPITSAIGRGRATAVH